MFECPRKNRRNKSKSTKTSRPPKRTAQPHDKALEGAVQERLNHLIEDGNDARMVYHDTEGTMEELPMSCVYLSVLPHQVPTTEEEAVNPEAVQAVKEWQRPKDVIEIRSFLRMASCYRGYIENFSNIAKPVIDLLKNNVPFVWTDKCEANFQELKS
jgi:hypothetical protein